MVGDRSAHPLLISLANINMAYRNKSSHQAYLLLALLPIPKFIERDKKTRGVLESRLIHECLDFILEPLKMAAKLGVTLNDPRGLFRYCFTPLAAYIADTPEAAMMSCVSGKTSHLMMAMYKQFGDSFPHEPRTASTTLAQLHALALVIDPTENIKSYLKEAKQFRLNGVHEPFWRDWPLADLPTVFPPETLHHLHKLFWDHDMRWCINGVGADEIDFRFSVLHPHTGYRHFKEGISKMKQVTERQHRDIQRYIVAVIAEAVSSDFVVAICALIDFRYLAQAPVVDEDLCTRMDSALQRFHTHKQAILDAGARTGKRNRPIENWHIPKLEFLQSVVRNIRANGALIQWSADVTEHAHIEVVKEPPRAGNNQNYEEQICRTLDRADKARRFKIATSTREAEADLAGRNQSAEGSDDDIPSDSDQRTDLRYLHVTPPHPPTPRPSFGAGRERKDYFQEAERLLQQRNDSTPFPLRTFSIPSTAFHLTRDPAYKQMSLDDAAIKFSIPDLILAVSYFLLRFQRNDTSVHAIGGRRPRTASVVPPFDKVEVWTGLRLQSRDYYCPNVVLDAEKLNALPPTPEWPVGRYDTALANIDPQCVWPRSGLSGQIHW